MKDSNNRTIKYMRLSVTDMCNFRCQYCMPENYDTPTHKLNLDDIELIASNLRMLGITKVKLTGGEPLVRSDISDIVRLLKQKCNIEEVTLTTNGALLDTHLDDLISAGLDALTISIDTLDETNFNDLVRRNSFERVLNNVKLAANSELVNVKLNVVPLKSLGEANIIELIEFANDLKLPIRFIEMMPIGLGRNFPGYDYKSLLAVITNQYGSGKESTIKLGNGPAKYFKYQNLDIKIGVISALSNKFCDDCNRIRVTSTGHLKQCLHYNYNIDLLAVLRTPGGLDQIRQFILTKPKEHAFATNQRKDIETLKMSEIGG